MRFNLDCRYFIGEKPCVYNRLCDGCPHYNPFGSRILIVGLCPADFEDRIDLFFADITAQKSGVFITWIVQADQKYLIDKNPYIDRILPDNFETELRLEIEEFSQMWCFDTHMRSSILARMVKANKKHIIAIKEYNSEDLSGVISTEPQIFISPVRLYPYPKILIIKLGAMGDVIRTTVLLKAIRRRYSSYHLTWLVDKNSVLFLEGNGAIDRVLPYMPESIECLRREKFDIIYSLDKEIRATACATLIKADKKYGFGLYPVGNIYPFNEQAYYSFSLGMSDQIKFFENKKTYQREILDSLGFADVDYDLYELPLSEFDLNYGFNLLNKKGVEHGKYIIGLNTGAGEIFATKRYIKDYFVSLIHMLVERIDCTVLILGGPSEVDRNKYILNRCRQLPNVVDTGCDNPLVKFMGIVNVCDVIVTGDTLALHLALAVRKRIVALFGSTCAHEIDLYNLGEKIVSTPDCAPCYKKVCPNESDRYMICMRQITVDRVFDAIQRQTELLEK